jgi:antiviral helicase SLH1
MSWDVKLTSRFIPGMVDSLNAEIALGTITSVQDAIQWLGYTYLFVRMRREPFIYGTSISQRDEVLLMDQECLMMSSKMILSSVTRGTS